MTGLTIWRQWLLTVAMALRLGAGDLVVALLRAALVSLFVRVAASRGILIVAV